MKALTIYQPWPWAIAAGLKLTENRGTGTAHRGDLAIHAGLRWHPAGEDSELMQAVWKATPGTTGDAPWRGAPQLVFGAVIAVADLYDVCKARTGCDCGPWAIPGRCHWKLSDVRTLATPVPVRGAQGVWALPPDVAAAVRRGL